MPVRNMGLSKTVSARALMGLVAATSFGQLGTRPQVSAANSRTSWRMRTAGTSRDGAML
jgi:hypothetical protein